MSNQVRGGQVRRDAPAGGNVPPKVDVDVCKAPVTLGYSSEYNRSGLTEESITYVGADRKLLWIS